MTQVWQRWSEKFNALPVFNRALILACVCIAAAAFYYFMTIAPLTAKKYALEQQILRMHTAIESAKSGNKPPPDPAAAKRAYRDALRMQLADIDQQMQAMLKGLAPPDEMPKMLEGILSHNRGLQLVELRKLPATQVAFAGESKMAVMAAEAGATQGFQPGRHFYQHGFQITLRGTYADVYANLVRLESLPWAMFWSQVNLNAEQHPVLTVTLTVYTLSLSKAWLIV